MRDAADPALIRPPQRASERPGRETLALAALALVLAGLAGWQLLGPADDAPPAIAMPVARPAIPATGAAQAARTDLGEILERPVFAPGRRRIAAIAEAQAAPPPPAPPARPPLAASHVMLGWTSSDGQLVAWVRAQGGGRPVRLRVGEELNGWTLVGTAGRRMLLFERDGIRQTLGTASAAAETPDEDPASTDDGTTDDGTADDNMEDVH